MKAWSSPDPSQESVARLDAWLEVQFAENGREGIELDVSAGAESKVVFLQGAGCPDGRDGSFFRPGGGECLITLSSPPRVIAHGPNP